MNKNVIIGIARTRDLNNKNYQEIKAILDDIGVISVPLKLVKSDKLQYKNDRLDINELNINEYLKLEGAEKIKNNNFESSNVLDVMQNISGVIFPGGSDISPTLYKVPEEWHGVEEFKKYDATRDVSDYILMKYCLEKDIPILGICRGFQLLAIVSGCSMIQDLNNYFKNLGINYNHSHRNNNIFIDNNQNYVPHDVEIIDKNSFAYQMHNKQILNSVTSLHHQSILSTDGTNLKVTGITKTHDINIIEIGERTDKYFAFGVQYHPESSYQIYKNNNDYLYKDDSLKYFTFFINKITNKNN